MCHGHFLEQRVTVFVSDLLRYSSPLHIVEEATSSYLETQPYDGYVDFDPSLYGSGSSVDLSMVEDVVLPESYLPGNNLGEIVKDYPSDVKKLDSDDVANIEPDALGSAGSLSAWFDCIIKDDLCSAAALTPENDAALVAKESPQNTANVAEPAQKSRKARKSAVKEQSHGKNDFEMYDVAPTLIDEKRKRRMSSNRASAQRSRQRKQERLDELEILTAQLRLENATLSRRSKLAEQLAKKFEGEKTTLAQRVEELKKELEVARRGRRQCTPDSGDESMATQNMGSSGICNMVEGRETSPDIRKELDMSFKDNVGKETEHLAENSLTGHEISNGDAKQLAVSSSDLPCGVFQELYDATESEKFDVSIGGDVPDLIQEQWFESFTECLSA